MKAEVGASASSSHSGAQEVKQRIKLPPKLPANDARGLNECDESLQDDVCRATTAEAENTYAGEMNTNCTVVQVPPGEWSAISWDSEIGTTGWHSATRDVVQEKSSRMTKDQLKERHISGKCTPCSYNLYKGDGCRLGDDCMFCHLCTKANQKRRKRQNTDLMKGLPLA